MKIGIIRKDTNIVKAVWAAVGEVSADAQWALLAKRGSPGEVRLGDLGGLR